jgi:hypothetical protein
MLPSLFTLVIFQIGSPFYAYAAMDHNAPIYASHIDNKHVPPGPAFIG